MAQTLVCAALRFASAQPPGSTASPVQHLANLVVASAVCPPAVANAARTYRVAQNRIHRLSDFFHLALHLGAQQLTVGALPLKRLHPHARALPCSRR